MQGTLGIQRGGYKSWSQGAPICSMVAPRAGFMSLRCCAVTQNFTFRTALCLVYALPSPLEILWTRGLTFSFRVGPCRLFHWSWNLWVFVYSTCAESIWFSLPNDPGPLMTQRTGDSPWWWLIMDWTKFSVLCPTPYLSSPDHSHPVNLDLWPPGHQGFLKNSPEVFYSYITPMDLYSPSLLLQVLNNWSLKF